MIDWSFEKVRALAPDGRSLKAAEKLANRARWPALGRAEGVVWGECLGSGRQPYRVQVSLARSAFKCSCPSRKRPCKHSVALAILWAKSPDPFPTGEKPQYPDWSFGAVPTTHDDETRDMDRASASQPARMSLFSDQYASEPPPAVRSLVKRVRAIVDSGVQLNVLLALNDKGAPSYDHTLAAELVGLGVPSFVCTPDNA